MEWIVHRSFIYLFLCSVAVVTPAFARDPEVRTEQLMIENARTDSATAAELARIGKLSMSNSPIINESAREDARDAISILTDLIHRETDTQKRYQPNFVRDYRAALDRLAAAIPTCDKSTIKSSVDTISGLMDQMPMIGGVGLLEDFDDEPSKAKLLEPVAYASMDPAIACAMHLKDSVGKPLHDALTAYDAYAKNTLEQGTLRVGRAQKLLDAWTKYRDSLSNSIEAATPAGKVADQLWKIIGVFCLFAVILFVAVRTFPTRVQFELVASGQVIQFATVMVLLIVICVLGISDILKENTLGTLLGGIGGYVLAQGVGRAARRDQVHRDRGPPTAAPPAPPSSSLPGTQSVNHD